VSCIYFLVSQKVHQDIVEDERHLTNIVYTDGNVLEPVGAVHLKGHHPVAQIHRLCFQLSDVLFQCIDHRMYDIWAMGRDVSVVTWAEDSSARWTRLVVGKPHLDTFGVEGMTALKNA